MKKTLLLLFSLIAIFCFPFIEAAYNTKNYKISPDNRALKRSNNKENHPRIKGTRDPFRIARIPKLWWKGKEHINFYQQHHFLQKPHCYVKSSHVKKFVESARRCISLQSLFLLHKSLRTFYLTLKKNKSSKNNFIEKLSIHRLQSLPSDALKKVPPYLFENFAGALPSLFLKQLGKFPFKTMEKKEQSMRRCGLSDDYPTQLQIVEICGAKPKLHHNDKIPLLRLFGFLFYLKVATSKPIKFNEDTLKKMQMIIKHLSLENIRSLKTADLLRLKRMLEQVPPYKNKPLSFLELFSDEQLLEINATELCKNYNSNEALLSKKDILFIKPSKIQKWHTLLSIRHSLCLEYFKKISNILLTFFTNLPLIEKSKEKFFEKFIKELGYFSWKYFLDETNPPDEPQQKNSLEECFGNFKKNLQNFLKYLRTGREDIEKMPEKKRERPTCAPTRKSKRLESPAFVSLELSWNIEDYKDTVLSLTSSMENFAKHPSAENEKKFEDLKTAYTKISEKVFRKFGEIRESAKKKDAQDIPFLDPVITKNHSNKIEIYFPSLDDLKDGASAALERFQNEQIILKILEDAEKERTS